VYFSAWGELGGDESREFHGSGFGQFSDRVNGVDQARSVAIPRRQQSAGSTAFPSPWSGRSTVQRPGPAMPALRPEADEVTPTFRLCPPLSQITGQMGTSPAPIAGP